MEAQLARAVYLLAKHKVQIPRKLAPYISGSEWLSQLHFGLSAALPYVGAPLEYLRKLYKAGESMGLGSEREARLILAALVDEELLDREGMSTKDRTRIYVELDRFMSSDGLLTEVEVDLSTVVAPPDIPKFDSGFEPLDTVLGGLYQGIFVIMARPGTGKTSLLITLMEELVGSGTSALFIENEIPQPLLLGRMKPLFGRVKFLPEKHRLICGSWSATDILNYVQDHPDPDRVVIYDSPDVVASGDLDQRRLTLERDYQELVKVKQLCRAVFVTSQPRRKDEVIKLDSVAESWAKAWYSDAVIGVQQVPPDRLRLKVVKNRFGPQNGQVTMEYDYESLKWSYAGELDSDEW